MLTATILSLLMMDVKPQRTVWLGGHREVLLGLKPYKDTVLGFYEFVPRALDGEAPDEMRVGFVGYRVYNDTWEGKQCMVLQTDGRRVQHLGEVRALDPFNPTAMLQLFTDMRKWRRCWVDQEGRVVRQEAFDSSPQGVFESSANFKSDGTIELTIKRNQDEPKMQTMYPNCGTEGFDSEFVPMIKDGKIALKEKTYWVLDARGGLKKSEARVAGRFTGSILFIKYEGYVVEIKSDGKTAKGFVSDDGELLKVVFPDKSAAMVEVQPHPWEVQARDKKKAAEAKASRLTNVHVRPGGG